jgi:hypothetical protein
MPTLPVADAGERFGFVENDPLADAIAQRLRHRARILGETFRRIAIGPAAVVLERLRQVPVIQRDDGANARFEHRIGDALVVIQSPGVHASAARGLDSRPCNRVTIALDVQLAQQRDVLEVAMIAIARQVAVVAVLDAARRVREAVPDGFAFAVFLPGTLDLIGRGGCAPDEIRRKAHGIAIGRCDHVAAGRFWIGNLFSATHGDSLVGASSFKSCAIAATTLDLTRSRAKNSRRRT